MAIMMFSLNANTYIQNDNTQATLYCGKLSYLRPYS